MWRDKAPKWHVWTVAHEKKPNDLVRTSLEEGARSQMKKSQVGQDSSRRHDWKAIKRDSRHHSHSLILVEISLSLV